MLKKKVSPYIQFRKSVTVNSILNAYSTDTSLNDTIFLSKYYEKIVNPVGIQLEGVYSQFRLDYPDYSIVKARKHFIAYVQAVETHLRMLIKYKINTSGKSRVISASLNDMRRASPRMTLLKNTTPVYAFDVFGKGKHMFSELTKADFRKGKLTQIYMNKSYIEFLEQVNDPLAIKLYYDDVDLDKAIWIPINGNSLNSYIRSCINELKKPNLSKNLKATLENNLKDAQRTLNVAEYFKEEKNGLFMPHFENPSPYGRMYYHKRNLQQIHKEVRKAILGDHHEYDLVAAVYAIRLLLARSIFLAEGAKPQEEECFPLTADYVKDRSRIRKDLLRHFKNTYNPEKAIKTVITAISFGAKFNAHMYKDSDNMPVKPALEILIRDPVDRANFIKDEWVIAFRAEQNILTDFIFNYYKQLPGLLERVKDIPNMYTSVTNRLRKSKLMAYLFQTTEYEIMDNITSNIDYLIRIHDAVLTKRKILGEERGDINYRLHTDYAPYIKLEQSTVDGYFNISDDKLEDIANHKEFIRKQEQLARNESKQKTLSQY